MDLPSLTDVRLRSPVLAAGFPSGSGDAALTVLVQDAAATVSLLTGRVFDVAGEGAFGCALEEVPAPLQPTMVRLAVSFAERAYVAQGAGDAEAAAEALSDARLASFSAGPYSESYFDPLRVRLNEMRQLDADPVTHSLLWLAATECVKAGWNRTWNAGTGDSKDDYPPAFAVESPDWNPEGELYDDGPVDYLGY